MPGSKTKKKNIRSAKSIQMEGKKKKMRAKIMKKRAEKAEGDAIKLLAPKKSKPVIKLRDKKVVISKAVRKKANSDAKKLLTPTLKKIKKEVKKEKKSVGVLGKYVDRVLKRASEKRKAKASGSKTAKKRKVGNKIIAKRKSYGQRAASNQQRLNKRKRQYKILFDYWNVLLLDLKRETKATQNSKTKTQFKIHKAKLKKIIAEIKKVKKEMLFRRRQRVAIVEQTTAKGAKGLRSLRQKKNKKK